MLEVTINEDQARNRKENRIDRIRAILNGQKR